MLDTVKNDTFVAGVILAPAVFLLREYWLVGFSLLGLSIFLIMKERSLTLCRSNEKLFIPFFGMFNLVVFSAGMAISYDRDLGVYFVPVLLVLVLASVPMMKRIKKLIKKERALSHPRH